MASMKVNPDVFKQIDRPCRLLVPARRGDTCESYPYPDPAVYTNKSRLRFMRSAWLTITSDAGSMRVYVEGLSRGVVDAKDYSGIVTGKSSLGYWVLDIAHITRKQP